MSDMDSAYAKLIIETQLRLREGVALSINTESCFIEFARTLARSAAKVTLLPVQIVETENGKILQVYPMDPQVPEPLRPDTTALAMCHIVNLDTFPRFTDETPADIAKNVPLLGTHHLLAEPVDPDRRVAASWVNIPYPTPSWGISLLGEDATERDLHDLFSRLMHLESETWWSEVAQILEKKRRLLAKGKVQVRTESSNFTAEILDSGVPGTGVHTTGTTAFIPSLPLPGLSVALNADTINGTITTTREFQLLGRTVRGARLTYENGKLVAYGAEEGNEALDALFSIDEGASKVSEISLMDCRYSSPLKTDHPVFRKSGTSCITLGGIDPALLDSSITKEECEETKINRSIVRVDLPIGSDSLMVKIDDELQLTVMEENCFSY